MATDGMQFSWRWNGGTISLNLGVIWEMSEQSHTVASTKEGPTARRRVLLALVLLAAIPSVALSRRAWAGARGGNMKKFTKRQRKKKNQEKKERKD